MTLLKKQQKQPTPSKHRMRRAIRNGADWIDISVPIRTAMVHYPGTPSVTIKRVHQMRSGDSANESQIRMGAHSGTHMDAPIHFLPEGDGIDQMPFSATIGRATVVQIHDRRRITRRELMEHSIEKGDRILFKTRNSPRCWETARFLSDFVYLETDAALWLVKRGIQTVGIDYLSVGGYQQNGQEVHRLLLQHGVWIIEGLDLTRVTPGHYEMICLPLRIEGADGAPSRAILRPSPPPIRVKR
ncbi:cyclase [Nitrospira sp.]|nr:cyclase [Nitrospira sp.]